MRISDVAKAVGIPVSTIRYYERAGIIPKPARDGRNRSFSDKDLRAIQFVRDAQSVGFSLSDISDLVGDEWDSASIAKLATQHRQTIRTRIETLKRVEHALSALEGCRCNTMDQCNLHVGLLSED